jgi:valyl-tRNA synthetase
MILMTICLLGDIPFRTVYLHGLVRDEQGRKMSKSLGNIIDPLEMIEKYGADATRLSLIIGAAPGNDMKLSEDRVRGYRNFVNKIWNIARFVLMQSSPDGGQVEGKPAQTQLSEDDKKILEDFAKVATQATASMEAFRFSEAADALYHYLWHTFADQVLETSKSVLQHPDTRNSRQYVLLSVLTDSLKLLHPFVPFVTEEIYQLLPLKDKKESLMIEQWPAQP